MGLRLTLQDKGQVLLDLPLDNSEWDPVLKERITRELEASEADFDTLCEISGFFANKRRLQMLSHILRDCNNSASFTDLLKVALNPKYVSDLVNKTSTVDIVVKNGRGYSVSPIGVGSLLLLSVATRRLAKEMGVINNDDKSFEAGGTRV
jgi:hypothetical protein